MHQCVRIGKPVILHHLLVEIRGVHIIDHVRRDVAGAEIELAAAGRFIHEGPRPPWLVEAEIRLIGEVQEHMVIRQRRSRHGIAGCHIIRLISGAHAVFDRLDPCPLIRVGAGLQNVGQPQSEPFLHGEIARVNRVVHQLPVQLLRVELDRRRVAPAEDRRRHAVIAQLRGQIVRGVERFRFGFRLDGIRLRAISAALLCLVFAAGAGQERPRKHRCHKQKGNLFFHAVHTSFH